MSKILKGMKDLIWNEDPNEQKLVVNPTGDQTNKPATPAAPTPIIQQAMPTSINMPNNLPDQMGAFDGRRN
jgi:hypothetical protein